MAIFHEAEFLGSGWLVTQLSDDLCAHNTEKRRLLALRTSKTAGILFETKSIVSVGRAGLDRANMPLNLQMKAVVMDSHTSSTHPPP